MSEEIKMEFGDLIKNAFGSKIYEVKGNNCFAIDVDKLEFVDEPKPSEAKEKESKELNSDENFINHKIIVSPCSESTIVSKMIYHTMKNKFNVDERHFEGKLKFTFLERFYKVSSIQMLL